MESSLTSRVLVVGAGISGAACANALRDAGVEVTLVDRADDVGGRMSSPELHGRPVDLGAAYFTSTDSEFAAVVDRWVMRGLVRPWTNTFSVFDPTGRRESAGPQRWAATDGLQALVRDLHGGRAPACSDVAKVEAGEQIVLAMPDPTAARIVGDHLDAVDWVDYEPVIAVAAGWDRRVWDLPAAAFVNDDPNVTLIADDGSRRGDAAPVLVAHTTVELARRHLDSPSDVIAPVLESVRRLLEIDIPPLWTELAVWPEAKPRDTHGVEPYALFDSVGVCGDSWCPTGSPRVEAAWLSGHRLGVKLGRRLG